VVSAPKEPEVPIYSVSNKQTYAVVGAFITSCGVVLAAVLSSQPDTADRYYGYQGRKLQQAVEDVSESVEALTDRVTIMELNQKQIIVNDKECEKRQESVKKELKWLHDKVVTYQATTKQVDAHQSQLIADCMRRTQ